jgi:hypothetical protein
MKQRWIGGISVGENGLGCMGMSQSNGPARPGLILTDRPEQVILQ